MNQRDMEDLLRSYDALHDLRVFLGVDNMAFGYNSILERLSVADVITRNVKVYEGDIEDWVLEVLDERESSYSERAKKLLGL